MVEQEEPWKLLKIGPRDAGVRLDKALFAILPDFSRSWLKILISRGQVRVEGRMVKPSYVARVGDRVEIDLEKDRSDARLALEQLQVPIIHEDPLLLVVDKPAGIAVHPNSPRDKGTLSQWANWRYGPLPKADDAQGRPGVVHRLDKETSGVMVMARTGEALVELKSQFKRRLTKKCYLALVYGAPEFASDHVDTQIARDPNHPERMRVVREAGRESSTYWEVLEDLGNWAWVSCRPKTGRTHQIRVHMASIGHSLVGDRLYRSPNAQRFPLPLEAPILGRHALHAAHLSFNHPGTQEPVAFESPLPQDMARLLAWLRERRDG